jgi:hypothetical protein
VKLTPGATYEVTADVYADIRARATIGVKWENYADGPSLDYVNGAPEHNLKVRFTVPAGMPSVCIFFKTYSPSRATTWGSVDNFKLVRVQ